MLNFGVPANFMWRLQLAPPLFIESIFVLILVVLLAVSFTDNFRGFFETYFPNTGFLKSSQSQKNTIVMHYPASALDSSSSSSIDLNVPPVRPIYSTPILKEKRMTRQDDIDDNAVGDNNDPIGRNLPLIQSSSFIATNSQIPIIDITAIDYSAYRHKLIENILRRQFENQQPPGDIVLNSIVLNSIDSKTTAPLNNLKDFFGFIADHRDLAKNAGVKEINYLYPIDRFLIKGNNRNTTLEKATETLDSDTSETDRFNRPRGPESFKNRPSEKSHESLMKKMDARSIGASSHPSVIKTGSCNRRDASGKGGRSRTRTGDGQKSADPGRSPRTPSTPRHSMKRNRKSSMESVDYLSTDAEFSESVICGSVTSSELPESFYGDSIRHRSRSPATKQPWIGGTQVATFNKKCIASRDRNSAILEKPRGHRMTLEAPKEEESFESKECFAKNVPEQKELVEKKDATRNPAKVKKGKDKTKKDQSCLQTRNILISQGEVKFSKNDERVVRAKEVLNSLKHQEEVSQDGVVNLKMKMRGEKYFKKESYIRGKEHFSRKGNYAKYEVNVKKGEQQSSSSHRDEVFNFRVTTSEDGKKGEKEMSNLDKEEDKTKATRRKNVKERSKIPLRSPVRTEQQRKRSSSRRSDKMLVKNENNDNRLRMKTSHGNTSREVYQQMQQEYIKRLRILSTDRQNIGVEDLATLSLTDIALKTIFSPKEIEEVQKLLNNKRVDSKSCLYS